MKSQTRISNSIDHLSRRSFLQGALAASTLAMSSALAGCQFSLLEQRIDATPSDTMESGEMINVNGTSLYHMSQGSGTPMLIMHGGLGLDHEYFQPALESWGDFAELHFYDHRGNGRSAAPEDWQSVTLDTFADDAEALRVELGLEKPILYGHSYGGFIALGYALRYQDSLSGIILGSTGPNTSYALNIPEWATEEALGALNAIFTEPLESDEHWAELWSTVLPLYWKDIDTDLAADIHSRTHYKADATTRSFQLLAEFDMIGQMSQITIPTLILSGRFDFVTVPQAHEDMHAEIPNSELVFFEDSGHFPFITEADRYTDVVRNWIAGL
ncbi:MAG: alpha/beta fold hydrolase [Chloroflexota bacterium]